MVVDMTSALNAYRSASKIAETSFSSKAESPAAATGDNSFVNMVTDSLKSAVQTGRQAEELSLKQISGEADLKDVVTAAIGFLT